MKLLKEIKTLFIKSSKKDEDNKEKELLRTKVIKGTDFAVREYGEVFKKLAEYDRTLN
ncbi:MAG TPA: hypothetical protein PLD14_03135 [Candidatus Pacearchaeota archaeon]|nr:hypothetical protein [Candidatus Pacearchaeota archaeon]HPR80191.1 hypothetical protein [Candidatus Pacearchaeota archaeon]